MQIMNTLFFFFFQKSVGKSDAASPRKARPRNKKDGVPTEDVEMESSASKDPDIKGNPSQHIQLDCRCTDHDLQSEKSGIPMIPIACLTTGGLISLTRKQNSSNETTGTLRATS
jgi:hypothetical protein